MKISVNSYSFAKLLKTKELTQKDLIKIVKDLGFDAIEFSDIMAPENTTKDEYAKVLCDESKRVGLDISCLVFGADFLNGSGGNLKKEIARVKKMLDIATILGVKYIRHDVSQGDGRPFDNVVDILADACREIASYGKEKGITTMVENHGWFCQDSGRMEKLYAKTNHDNFGILLDIGNFLCADQEPLKAVSVLASFAKYVHIKDFYVKSFMSPDPGEGFFSSRGGNYLRGAIIGHGDVPVLQCLKALKNAKYDGYLSVEFEGMEENIKAVQVGLNNLKRYVEKVWN